MRYILRRYALCDKFQVWTKMPGPGLEIDRVSLHGRLNNCKEVKKALLKLVREWQDDDDFAEEVIIEAMIDYRVHSRLQGKRAGIVSKVMKQFNVVVTFPDRREPCNRVLITGRSKNTEDAKDYLADLAQDLMVDVYGGLQ